MRNSLLAIASLILANAVFVPAPTSAAEVLNEKESCERYASFKVPKFKVIRKSRPYSLPGLQLFVSILPSDVERDKLIALSCHLGKEYAREKMLSVWILDSEKAAKHFNPQGEGNDRATNSARRVLYGFDHQDGAGSQSLQWTPDPNNRARMIVVDLGIAPTLPSPKE
jgi:hypothetical protein